MTGIDGSACVQCGTEREIREVLCPQCGTLDRRPKPAEETKQGDDE